MADLDVKVFRFDPDTDDKPRYDTYQVTYREGMTILDVLFYILENLDGSLAFRYACREAICGNCAMYVNGLQRLACKTQVKDLKTTELFIEPLPSLPVIKDLVVDLDSFFGKYVSIKPYLIPAESPPEKEYYQSQSDRHVLNEAVDCILCGACYSSCPAVWTDEDYLGPAALIKAFRFYADSRDGAQKERLDLVAHEHGLWRCHTVFNCVEVCPKGIDNTSAIQYLKKQAVGRALGMGVGKRAAT
ncbi:MAG: succinate dehydrogenase iron-sulfur subunit [Firmicutes bacterium]|nr:succinate dehydrogenase iron-sulfur subunit [Bacillota bacterium]MCL5040556.1 succinate dehydrogenase iron-sulfur subunit [Bacillota bacterium]